MASSGCASMASQNVRFEHGVLVHKLAGYASVADDCSSFGSNDCNIFSKYQSNAFVVDRLRRRRRDLKTMSFLLVAIVDEDEAADVAAVLLAAVDVGDAVADATVETSDPEERLLSSAHSFSKCVVSVGSIIGKPSTSMDLAFLILTTS